MNPTSSEREAFEKFWKDEQYFLNGKRRSAEYVWNHAWQARAALDQSKLSNLKITEDWLGKKLAITDDGDCAVGTINKTESCMACGKIGERAIWDSRFPFCYVCKTCKDYIDQRQRFVVTDEVVNSALHAMWPGQAHSKDDVYRMRAAIQSIAPATTNQNEISSKLVEVTDEMVRQWRNRHDLFGILCLADARCAIEDAQSLQSIATGKVEK